MLRPPLTDGVSEPMARCEEVPTASPAREPCSPPCEAARGEDTGVAPRHQHQVCARAEAGDDGVSTRELRGSPSRVVTDQDETNTWSAVTNLRHSAPIPGRRQRNRSPLLHPPKDLSPVFAQPTPDGMGQVVTASDMDESNRTIRPISQFASEEVLSLCNERSAKLKRFDMCPVIRAVPLEVAADRCDTPMGRPHRKMCRRVLNDSAERRASEMPCAVEHPKAHPIPRNLRRSEFGIDTRERGSEIVEVQKDESLLIGHEATHRGILEELIAESTARREDERRSTRMAFTLLADRAAHQSATTSWRRTPRWTATMPPERSRTRTSSNPAASIHPASVLRSGQARMESARYW